MGAYLNGKKVGAYLNGKRVGAYLNGKLIWGKEDPKGTFVIVGSNTIMYTDNGGKTWT
jgi:hypothetical protein